MIRYDGKFFWLWVFVMVVKVLFAITRNTESEITEETIMATENYETENETMTPTYMPPPREAGGGEGSKQQEDSKWKQEKRQAPNGDSDA